MESKTKVEYADLNDSKLVCYVRENSDEAKDILYQKYLPLVYKEIGGYRVKARMLGIDEADLSQEAMLAFSHAINNYNDEGEAKFITFVTICIRRKLYNFVSKFDTGKSKALDRPVPLDALFNDNEHSYLAQLEDTHMIDPLYKMINTESLDEALELIAKELSQNERLALKYDIEGKSVNEIAKLMNMNTKQIYNLIHRARIKIKP